MKPGDLVKLVRTDPDPMVYVAAINDREQLPFDVGTLAVFLNEFHSLNEHGREKKLWILVEGRIGWIYESECEVIDETR